MKEILFTLYNKGYKIRVSSSGKYWVKGKSIIGEVVMSKNQLMELA